MSNSLNADQVRHFVEPDLGPNCLHRLSTDNTSRQSYGDSINYTATDKKFVSFCLLFQVKKLDITHETGSSVVECLT